jgi:hypothetical protein
VQGATTADFGLSIITVNSVTVTDATHATVNLTLPALTQHTGSSPGGAVGLTVRMTSNGEIAASNPNAFQILPPQKLTSVTPASGTQGQTALVELTANPAMPFQQGMTVDFGSGITVSSFQPSGNIAFINISIASNASPGPRTVTVTSNPFVQTAIDGFAVVAASP